MNFPQTTCSLQNKSLHTLQQSFPAWTKEMNRLGLQLKDMGI